MNVIVVGLDGSPRSPTVLRAALALAGKQGAKLYFVRAVPVPVGLPPDAYAMAADLLPEHLRAYAQTALDAEVREVPTALREGVEARLGTPWQVLCDAAIEKHADVVVVGTHGYNWVDRVVGTTAARVVNHAPCSVYVVREASVP